MKPNRTTSRYGGALIADNSYSPASEAYRMLRTNLLLASGQLRSVMLTSPTSGDGKSITCANLGLTMSQNEQRVAILDADLRMPSQHLIFHITPGRYPAMLHEQDPDARWGAADIAHCAVDITPTLSVIPAGPTFGSPAEMLGSRRFESFFAALLSCYDLVLVDTPPAGLVTDAAMLASRVDGVIMVLDYGKQQRRVAHRALKSLASDQINLLGAVLNRTPEKGFGSYGSYGHDRNPGLVAGR